MEPSIESAATGDGNVSLRVKQPKRILHFSDGTVEEYSDDEPDGGAVESSQAIDEVIAWILALCLLNYSLVGLFFTPLEYDDVGPLDVAQGYDHW